MFDAQHLYNQGADFQLFTQPCAAAEWHTWMKPRRASTIFMVLMSSGGGGAGGVFDSAGIASAGGPGGGGSGVTTLIMPAWAVPDVLYLQVGMPGAGAVSAGLNGSSGALSYVSVRPSTVVSNVMAVSGAAAPTGAAAGSSGVPGTAGVGGTLATIGGMPLSAACMMRNFTAGMSGGTASPGLAGDAIAIPTTGVIAMGGAGGGGYDASNKPLNGGQITAISNSLLSTMRPVLVADGANGYLLMPPTGPLFSFPGLGGAATSSGPETGRGGNGGPGSGGGGGGALQSAGFGAGGDGGPGLILMIAA